MCVDKSEHRSKHREIHWIYKDSSETSVFDQKHIKWSTKSNYKQFFKIFIIAEEDDNDVISCVRPLFTHMIIIYLY